MSVTFLDGATPVTVEYIPIKSVPFAQQANEVGGYGINNLFKISGSGSPSVVFDPSEVENLKSFSSNPIVTLAPSAAGSGNQILGMNAAGDGMEYKSITAGSNVTINQTPGGIEISASGGGGGSVTSVGVSGAPLSLGGSVTAPVISLAQAGSGQSGFLSAADWALFNSKQPAGSYLTSIDGAMVTSALGFAPLNPSLASGQVFVGNGSNAAAGRLLRISDIRSASGAGTDPFLAASGACSAGEALSYNSVNDKLECSSYTLTASQVNNALGFTPQPAGSYLTGITGDVVATGPGSASATIQPGVVSYSKIQNVSANNRILGRATAGAGVLEEIIIGSGLAISGGSLTATNTASGSVTSVGISVPAYMTQSGGPVTNAGTIALGFGSQSAAQVFASPSGAAGAPVFRSLAAVDIPNLDASKITSGTFNAAQIPNLDAGKITSGAFDIARIPTGATAATVAIGNDSRFPSATCAAGNKMRWNGTAWVCEADANSGGTISALTGDVTASGSGSVAATVASVGGVTAANVAAGANLANAATSANTLSAIVRRDGSGNFTAGTITANLTGNVTGNLTGNVTGNVSGTSANVTGTVAVANGGTGIPTIPTNGQILIGNGTGYTLATITAGSGVTITNTAGSITISASGGSSGRTSCPSGFSLVGTSGSPEAYCISTNEETSATWVNAVTNCSNKNPAARLCSAGEWAHACVKAATYGISGMTGNFEWVADLDGDGGQVMGNSGCDSFYNGYLVGFSSSSRCCFR